MTPYQERTLAYRILVTKATEHYTNLAMSWSRFLSDPNPENARSVAQHHERYQECAEILFFTPSTNRSLPHLN